MIKDGQWNEVGVRDSDGTFHHFRDGESFSLVKEPGKERQPYITLRDGKTVPFESWKSGEIQKSEAAPTNLNTPNRDTLKSIYDKCTQKYPGKYENAIFGTNVELDTDELAELDELVDLASHALDEARQQLPLYEKFEKTRLQLQRLGTLFEEYAIDEDPSLNDVMMESVEGRGWVIKAPPDIRNCYLWGNKIMSLRESVRIYKAGAAKGTAASGLGQDIKDLYRLLKQLNKV